MFLHLVAPQLSAQAESGAKEIRVAPLATAKGVFKLSANPLWEIGGLQDNEEDEFDHKNSSVRTVRLASGGLAVIDVNKVRIFDARRKQHAVTGRFGHGPNEFAQIDGICRTRGDTIVVVDQNFRNTVIAPNGTIVRQWPTETHGSLTGVCFNDGTFLVSKLAVGNSAPGSRVLSRVDLSGTLVKSLGVFSTTLYGTTRTAPVILSRAGSTFYIADAKTLHIQQFDMNGKLLNVLKLDEKPETMTGDALRPDFAPKYTPGVKPPPRPRLTQVTVWPYYLNVLHDESGRWWIRAYPRDFMNDPQVWTAVDSAGNVLGELTIPKGKSPEYVEISEFTKDGVFTKRRDADGAVHFSMYRLTFSAGR